MVINEKFTDEELWELYEQGLTDKKISKKLGVSKYAVCSRRNMLLLLPNLPPNGKFKRGNKLETYIRRCCKEDCLKLFETKSKTRGEVPCPECFTVGHNYGAIRW